MAKKDRSQIWVKTYQFRLKLTKEEEQRLQVCADGTRFIYNWGLAYFKDCLKRNEEEPEAKHPFPRKFDMIKMITPLKRQPEHAWLYQVPNMCLQQAIIDLCLSMTAFFRERKRNPLYGFPRFKKRGFRESFRFAQGIEWSPYRIKLPVLGTLSYYHSYYRPVTGEIKQATIKWDGLHWYICIVTERPALNIAAAPQEAVTISMKDIEDKPCLVVGDKTIEIPRSLEDKLPKLVRLSRRFSRCTKDSKRWHKANKRLTKLHVKIANKRKDFLHKTSAQIVEQYNHIQATAKDVKKEIMENTTKAANRKTHDCAWSNFIEYLKYKSLWNGKKLDIIK